MQWQLLLTALAVQAAARATQNNDEILRRDDGPAAATAHPDGQCSQPLGGGSQASFQFKTGFPGFDTYKAQSYPGAETKDNGGGYAVYWNIPQPAPGCRNILMVPYSQPSHDTSSPAPGGVELVNTDRAGCFSTTIRVGEDVLLTYCCGSGDCQSASLGSGALLASPIQSGPAPDAQGTKLALQGTKVIGGDNIAHSTVSKRDIVEGTRDKRSPFAGSAAARAGQEKRWYYPAPPPPPAAPSHSACSFGAGSPFPRLGRQVVVSEFTNCNSGSCPVQVQHQSSYATTMSSSKEQTLTNSVGGSVAVEAGVDFIADAKVTATVTTDWSKAITDTTGKDITTGNTTSVTTQINVQAGTNVAVSFIPLYECWTGAFDCGHGKNDGIDLCQPSLLADGATQDGYYRAISAP